RTPGTRLICLLRLSGTPCPAILERATARHKDGEAIVARYRGYEDYDDRGPRRRPPSRRARSGGDDYYQPRRPAPSRYGRRPPPPSRRARSRARKQSTSPGLIIGLITNSVLVAVVGIIYVFFPATWQRIIHFRDYTPPLAAGADVIVL